jgi:RNA polymerase sigma-70 factor (ECF subfamily)
LDSLASVFLSHRGSQSSADPDVLSRVLEEIDRAARSAWPQLALAPERFISYLAARVSTEVSDLALALKETHAGDLFLACACVEGVPGAVEALRAHTRTAIETFVRGIDPSAAAIDDVAQALFEKLLVSDSQGGPARLTAYAGRGPLAGWIGVAAQRLALSMRRAESAQARARERAALEELSIAGDTELAYLKQRYRSEYEAAFAKAAALLTVRERAILQLHVSGGMTLEALGAMYRVNPSTISRWIAAAQDRLAAETEKDLRQRLHLSANELHSLTRLVITQLDFSVVRMLQDKPTRT